MLILKHCWCLSRHESLTLLHHIAIVTSTMCPTAMACICWVSFLPDFSSCRIIKCNALIRIKHHDSAIMALNMGLPVMLVENEDCKDSLEDLKMEHDNNPIKELISSQSVS
ncbi:hypothetical protein PR048_032992 [Dryococelus australis]|uniref:Uncharacterized protein n=1 Tax=Dryococelus australis TaxID=614101 RepID=A0ABQ9G3T2_9NEOP|nr:hypothetical protein PR048_032992 [Dryococelus australis]